MKRRVASFRNTPAPLHRVLLLFAGLLLVSGCTNAEMKWSKVGELSTDASWPTPTVTPTPPPDLNPPTEPSALTLGGGLTSPAKNRTPTLVIHGVEPGSTVAVYAGSSCDLPTLKGETTPASSTAEIILTALSFDGSYTFFAKATDPSGNESPCSTASVSYVLDTTPPSLTGLSNDLVSTRSKTWSWSCSETNCFYRFSISTDSTESPATAFAMVNTATQGTGTGTYYLHIQAKDELGNETAVFHYSAVLDNTAPPAPSALALESPASSPGTDTTPTVRVSGISLNDRVKLYRESACKNYLSEQVASGSTVDITTPVLSNGTHLFYATAEDALGNVSECSTAFTSYTLDAIPVSVTGLASDLVAKQKKVWNWGCNKASCTYRILLDQIETSVPTGTYTAVTTASQETGDGPYYLHVQAMDANGHESAVLTVKALLDNTAPPAPFGLTLLAPTSSPGTDSTPVISILGVTAGDTVELHKTATCSSLSASGVALTNSISLPASPLAKGFWAFFARTTDPAGNISSCSTVSTTYQYSPCPTNYIRVPGNADYQTKDFCVSKYEMKAMSGTDLIGNGNTNYWSSYTAASRPDGTPWVNITHANAITECAETGADYALINNAQWQTIARNISEKWANWNGWGTTAILNRGSTDNGAGTFWPSGALQSSASDQAPDTVDLSPYFGTGQDETIGWDQKRTHALSNGEVIWDFSGNVMEWIKDEYYRNYGGSSFIYLINGLNHPEEGWIGGLLGDTKFHFGPKPDHSGTMLHDGSLGFLRTGPASGLIARGGNFGDATHAGIFAADLTLLSGNIYNNVGFRCVWNPLPAPSAMQLFWPTSSPSTDSTPEIQIFGVPSGSTVRLYTTPTCNPIDQVATAVAAGNTVVLSPSLGAYSLYTFYSDVTMGGQTSDCSHVKVVYEYKETL